MHKRVNGQKIANIVGIVIILSMMLAIVPSGVAPVSAAPPQSPPSGPTAQQGVAHTLRIYGTGWSRQRLLIEGDPRAGDITATDPVLGTAVEDLPYTDPGSIFDPEGPQAPSRDSVTFNPVWMYEGATRDENWAKGLYQKILTPINASEKVWFRMWYEPEHWDKDLNGNGELDIADPRWEFEPTMPVTDIWYPALMQEFTYLLMEGRQLTAEPPPVPTWGNVGTSFVFPVGMKYEDLFTPNGAVDMTSANARFGYGLTSLDGDFDGIPDIVYVESEGSLYALTSIAADLDGDGLISRLDRDGFILSGTELAVLRLGATPIERGRGVQFLDHLAMVEQVSDTGVQLGIYYTGDLTPRPFPSVTLQIGDMVLAGSQGPGQLIRAVRNGGPGTNMTRFPTGPWFVYLQGVDRDEEQAILIVGRAVGATHSAMEDGMYREDRRPGDPWFLKRFYVDGHEYNVVAIMTRYGGDWRTGTFGPHADLDEDNDGFIDPPYDPYTLVPDRTQFQFITLRTPIPKVPVRIAQHSVQLQHYEANDNLSVLPPYNYEHYYIQDINAITKFSEYDIWDPVQQRWEISVKSVGRLVGPVPPFLQKNKTLPYVGNGPNSPYTDARETSLYYVEEDKNPQFLGMLRELYSERDDGAQYWSTRQFMTVPWWYTDVVFPDVREAIHGQGNPDLYLLKSVFFNAQSERRYWLRTAPDWAELLGTGEPPVPIMFWFDPAVGGKKYKDTEGLRIYGDLIYGEPVLGEIQDWTWPDGILGNKGAGDVNAYMDRLANYPVEVLPYTDPLAPFDPDHVQAPRKDFVTLNPAYMNEYENGQEPLVDLYRQISIRESNAGEKVFFRMWYEPTYVDKIVRAEVVGNGDPVVTPTEVMTFPAVMQEFTYMYLDMNDQPSAGQPGKSVFAFPIATGARELPAPVGGSIPGGLLPSAGYGLTTFDADFDGLEDAVTIHSEWTLSNTTVIRADFNGNNVIDYLDTDGTPLSGDELVIFARSVHLQRGQSAQLLDHMVSLANIATPAVSADLTLWYTGGGMHANNSKHPDLVPGSPVTLRPGEMAIVDRTGYRRILAGGTNLGHLNGAWFVYVDQINSATETVNLLIGRALGATHSAIDNAAGGHDLVPGDPWYLKRFFVDGHEYNVVALMTVTNTLNYPNEDLYDFKYITIRTPVPKPEDFVNYQDSQILEGYWIQDSISVMPPFNYLHTVREDVLSMPETWNNPNPQVIPANRTELTLGNSAYMLWTDPNCIGRVLAPRPPLNLTIVDEAREPQFYGELKEIYLFVDDVEIPQVWLLTEYRTSPDKYTELRFPAGEKYLMTTDWWWYNLRADFACTQYLPPVGVAQMPPYRVMFWYDPTDSKDIYINTTTACEPPRADFSATPTQGYTPLPVNFTDLSVGDITSWSWTFGDGGTSSQQNPSHTYTLPGVYTVTLTVSGSCGMDTETKTEYILVTTCALIRLSPTTQTVGVGQTVAVGIRVENVFNLYGVDLQLAFDYTRVQVVDADLAMPGIQITPGPFLPVGSGHVQNNSADNGTGVIRYTFTLQNPAPPASGSGVVATVHFRGLMTGTAHVAFTLGQLVDRYGTQLCSTTQGGSLEVVITTGSISGQVSLQSRTDHSGVSVTAGALPSVSTDSGGMFTIAGVPAGTYTVIASKAGYLSARKTGVVVPASGSVNIGSTMLLGGDANNDGTITIVDLVIVGAMYGSTPPADSRADINGDGTCNLIDLVLVGANYNRTGPTDWGTVAAAASARSQAKLGFSPSFRILPAGAQTTVEVVASGAADLYAGAFEIRYDPAALAVLDADPDKEGVQIGVGDGFAGDSAFVALNSVDEADGVIRFAATLLDPTPALQGNAVLARITLKGVKSGPTMLRFGNAQLLTAQAETLDVKAQDGSLWLGPIRGIGADPDIKLLRIQ